MRKKTQTRQIFFFLFIRSYFFAPVRYMYVVWIALFFCICVALLIENQVQLGIVHCPNTLCSSGNELGCLFIAVRGKGAYEVLKFCH